MTISDSNGITEIIADTGAWLTQNHPTMYRLFLKRRALPEGEDASSWRDATQDEKDAFSPPPLA